MKKVLLFLSVIVIAGFSVQAQGNAKNKSKANKGKGTIADKVANATKDKEEKQKHDRAIWEGTKDNDGGGPKPSKNQPAKVRAAFQRDYPNATNVSWSKYRGDWTATFRRGMFGWSTAVYHANGERRDTRTPVPPAEIPRKIEDIFKKRPDTRLEEVIKIEVPKTIKDIFRIKTTVDGSAKFVFYDADGLEVQYNY